jgi:hypothetical protein
LENPAALLRISIIVMDTFQNAMNEEVNSAFAGEMKDKFHKKQICDQSN